jgi:hypothetical protein
VNIVNFVHLKRSKHRLGFGYWIFKDYRLGRECLVPSGAVFAPTWAWHCASRNEKTIKRIWQLLWKHGFRIRIAGKVPLLFPVRSFSGPLWLAIRCCRVRTDFAIADPLSTVSSLRVPLDARNRRKSQ